MNNFGQSWTQPWGTPWGPYNAPANSTNKIYVTSLEDALNRTSVRGSEMVYFHQDSNEFYVVKTDADGRKSWMGFNYSVPNQDANTPATKADLKELIERVEKLESKEVPDNGKLDG